MSDDIAALIEHVGIKGADEAFIARAFGDTVHEFPKVNASVGDDALVVHHDVNLSIAVDLDFEGLVAPVIRDADGKRLRLIAREIRDRIPLLLYNDEIVWVAGVAVSERFRVRERRGELYEVSLERAPDADEQRGSHRPDV